MKPLAIVSLILAAMFLASPRMALAGSSGFGQLDSNRDGKITKEELSSQVKDKKNLDKAFRSLDKDGDGALTENDARLMFKEMDKNHDGKVSKKEYDDYYRRWQQKLEAPVNDRKPRASDFDDLDKNRDGYADFDETFTRWPSCCPNGAKRMLKKLEDVGGNLFCSQNRFPPTPPFHKKLYMNETFCSNPR